MLLWRKNMGATVLDAGMTNGPGLHVYAHCLRGVPGGVAMLAINTSRTQQASISLPMQAERYTLASAGQELADAHVQLNGQELMLGDNDALPRLDGSRVPPGTVQLAPAAITFLAVANPGSGGSRAPRRRRVWSARPRNSGCSNHRRSAARERCG